MPVEIRELVIKTEVRTQTEAMNSVERSLNLEDMKKEILSSCKRMIHEQKKRSQIKR